MKEKDVCPCCPTKCQGSNCLTSVFVLQMFCWSVRPTCPPHTNSAENHVSEPTVRYSFLRSESLCHKRTLASLCLSVYRVIKNQPPPILSIELDHNPFKCPAPGCTKSFRKAILLHYHIKYYHSDQQLDEGGSEDAHR